MSFRPSLPTDLAPREWSVLRHAWARGRFTAREIASDLAAAGDPLSKSAVLTLLQRAERKGYLERAPEADSRLGNCYAVRIPYDEAIRREIQSFFTFLRDDPHALRLVADELARRTS